MKYWEDCTRAQKVERWENCRRVLRALSPHERKKHWNMSVWGAKTECGTIACAAGYCGLNPWFRRRGFKMDFVLDESLKALYPDVCWSTAWSGDSDIAPTLAFFGERGSSRIFHDPRPRSVGRVIKEVEAHIKWLKTAGTEEIEE